MVISGDGALALSVLFGFLAMTLWGVFQTFWPAESHIKRPGGGHRTRDWNEDGLHLLPVRVSVRSGRR